MTTRPPSDAVVALRSLGRRYRGMFAGLGEDESPDDLAHRVGADGLSALDQVVAATRTISLLGRALEQIVTEDDPALHPAVADPTARQWDDTAGGTVDERVAELESEAERLADRVEHLPAEDWARTARVAGHDADATTLGVLWDAVDSAIAHLKAAERTLTAVRGKG
jgi:hypothetical protein